MTDLELASKAQAVAGCLSYNDDQHQAAAKHTLRECAHRIDFMVIRAHKKHDGLFLVNGRGKSRYATWRERLAFWIAGTLPREI